MIKAKYFLIYLILFLALSCGKYRYFAPTANTALFKNEVEVHVEGSVGSSGPTVKAAVSLPGKIGLIGLYNGSFPQTYRTKEYEIGLGYYTNSNPKGIFVLGGMGFGNNFEYTDSNFNAKSWEGSFIKPFIQFNGGLTGAEISTIY